jgi:hypothetical protein
MPACTKLIEPGRDDLTRWFKKARHGDQCQVVTVQGEIYTHLTKLSPSRVKWKVSGFTGQDIDLSNSMRFTELAETWDEIAMI